MVEFDVYLLYIWFGLVFFFSLSSALSLLETLHKIDIFFLLNHWPFLITLLISLFAGDPAQIKTDGVAVITILNLPINALAISSNLMGSVVVMSSETTPESAGGAGDRALFVIFFFFD